MIRLFQLPFRIFRARGRIWRFVKVSISTVLRGGWLYYTWLAFLALLILLGAGAYWQQLQHGLQVTGMRNPVAWAFYIGNFTFMDGLAVTVVLLVIPAYAYKWKHMHHIVVVGLLFAVCAVIMAMLFVGVDIGRPERAWHLIPFIGVLNFPRSIMAWDIMILVVFMCLNALLALYFLYRRFVNRPYNTVIIGRLMFLFVPIAIAVQTIAAFLYAGLPGRSYWNTAILAPRFLVSALCAGPALLLILLQILEHTSDMHVEKQIFDRIASLMAYAMTFNLLLLSAELFTEFYSDTNHSIHIRYLLFGLHGHRAIVPYGWGAILLQTFAFGLYIIPQLRKRWWAMNAGALCVYFGVYLEKGISLVIPGLTPSGLGEVFVYRPSWVEILVSMGVFGIGFFLFTLMLKFAVPVMTGKLRLHMFVPSSPQQSEQAPMETASPDPGRASQEPDVDTQDADAEPDTQDKGQHGDASLALAKP